MTANYYGAGYPAISSAWLALAFAGVACLYLFIVKQGFQLSSKISFSTRWLLLPLLGGLLLGSALLFLPLVLSPDIQSYIAASQAGARYYAYPPAGFLPTSTPILYGPSWLAIASLLVSTGSHNPLLVIMLFRGLELLAHLANTGLIWAILSITVPAQRLPGALLYAWNPLVLVELAGNGHYDGLVICLLLLAIWLYLQRAAGDHKGPPLIHPTTLAPTGSGMGGDYSVNDPVGARAAERRGEGLYGRPPLEYKASSPRQEDTAIRWPYEIGALILVGLAISMDWLALVIAPSFVWFMVRGRPRIRTALKGFGLRMLLVLFVVAVTYIPVWQGGTTFLAITSSIDLQRLAHSPLALLAAPLDLLYAWLINLAHIPSYPNTPIDPASAAALTIIAPALFVFGLLYLREMGRVDRRVEALFTGMCIVMVGFVALASLMFWPWYIIWIVWLVALRPNDTLSKALLLLSCTALLYYPLLALDATPFAFLTPLCIFGIPFAYFVGMRFIASSLASRSHGQMR